MLEPSAKVRPIILARADTPFSSKKKMPVAKDFHNKGADLVEKGDYSAAIVEYRRALSLDPGSLETRVDLAWALMVLGKLSDAKKLLVYVLAKDPLHSRAHRNLGVLYAKLKKSDLAEKELLESIRLDPENGNTFYNLAVLYHMTGKKKGAILAIERAAALDPADPRIKAALEIFTKPSR